MFLITTTFAVDLVPKENVEKWIQCLQLEFPVVVFKASQLIQDKTVVRDILCLINNACLDLQFIMLIRKAV